MVAEGLTTFTGDNYYEYRKPMLISLLIIGKQSWMQEPRTEALPGGSIIGKQSWMQELCTEALPWGSIIGKQSWMHEPPCIYRGITKEPYILYTETLPRG